MKSKIFLILIAAMLTMPAFAQKRKTPAKKNKPAPVVVVEENTKFDEMLEATQQIVIIDSVVVDKQQFLKAYKLSAEAGAVTGFNQFFKSEEQPYSTVYVNQMNNKTWFANDGRLYTSDKLGNDWSEPTPLEGLGRFQRTNYPFMLSDGTTLYFAAISSEDGLGGLDIYISRYDSESGQYLLAENIGLPFNSDANDYMYAVDELTNIGYFASDRRQPEGKVCIYTFIPNQKRLTYSTGEYDEDVIRSRAKIERIADTWGDGNARKEALARLESIGKKAAAKKSGTEFTFIINDDVTYNSPSDFRDADNQDRIKELMQMRKSYQSLETELEKLRNYYAKKASNAEISKLRDEILGYEKEYYQIESGIRELEKQIRNAEIKVLK